MRSKLEKSARRVYNRRHVAMTPSETEAALRKLFQLLKPPARAVCLYPKPPQRLDRRQTGQKATCLSRRSKSPKGLREDGQGRKGLQLTKGCSEGES